MAKLKRYLGLAVAIALLVLAFLPVGNPSYRLKAAQVTPLDDTVLAHVTNAGGRSSYLWMGFASYIDRCHIAKANPYRTDVTCSPDDYVLHRLAKDDAESIAVVEPNINQLLTEYSEAEAADKPRAAPSAVPTGRPQLIYSERLVKAEKQLGLAIAKYLEFQRNMLATPVYLVHGLVLLAFLFLVWFRENVGGLLLWPVSLLFGAAKAGGKAAKAIHEKV